MATNQKHRAVTETKYPLDYNKNNRDQNFEGWKEYIHEELYKDVPPGVKTVRQAQDIANMRYHTYGSQALKKPQYQPGKYATYQEMIKGDRIIYLMIYIAAIAFAIIYSIK